MKLLRNLLLLTVATLLWRTPGSCQENRLPVSSNESQLSKSSHKSKSINDVQAIGIRSMGKTGLGNWYSLEKEIAMGREFAASLDASSKLIADPIVTEYVNRLGQNLVRNSDAKVPFTIKVIDSDEINAFALPGGFLYVNSGLILAAQDEAELAGVMAHEIAHVAARHATRTLTRSQMFNLASIPLIFVGGGIGLAVQQAAGLVVPLSMMKFSRAFEAEADYLGEQYLYKAGYDPQALITFFERIQAQEKKQPGLLSKAFAGHPQTSDRVRKTQIEIGQILPAREAYILSTSEFDDVKLTLGLIEARKNIVPQDSSHPTLRRRDSGQTPDSEPDEDHPILKRKND